MKKVYFITKTLPESNTGGGIVRRGTIDNLKKNGYEVIIVAPSSSTNITTDRIYVKGLSSKFDFNYNVALFRIGLKWDFMQKWAGDAFEVLKGIVQKEDIVLATSGGEMGPLMLAALLKEKVGCKTIYNLHDPISFTLLKGRFSTESRLYVRPRDKKEKELFSYADNVVTSSSAYSDWLKVKYPEMQAKFSCHHFGYTQKIDKPQLSLLNGKFINVVYGGAMGSLQSPGILVSVAEHFKNVHFTFVGDVTFEIPTNASNVKVLTKMSYSDYITYMVENADIGFFSLKGHISRWCVPSKLYEYINAGIPMLAAIEGDARDIVRNNRFGEVCDYSVESISDGLKKLLEGDCLSKVKENIIGHREEWYMEHTINELIMCM